MVKSVVSRVNEAKLDASKGTRDNQHCYAFTISDDNLTLASDIDDFLVYCGAKYTS